MRPALILSVALLAIASLGWWLSRDATRSGLGAAIDLAADVDGFSSTDEATGTFARIAELLRTDAIECRDDDGEDALGCQALSQAFAVAQTIAVTSTRCTAPGIHDLRTAVLDHLRAVEHLDARSADLPPVPEFTRC